MNSNFVETIKINSLHCLPPYDTTLNTESPYLSVGHIDNKYGVLKNDGTEFLPFEYDNITIWGFGLLQLSLNGKLGLLHIKQLDDTKDFFIAKQIACAYDVIRGKYEGVLFLEKYGLPTELFRGHSVQAYLTEPEILTDEQADAVIMSTNHKLLYLKADNNSIIISVKTGKTIVHMSNGYTLGGYDTDEATILQQHYNGTERLLSISNDEDDEICEYIFDGMSAYVITGVTLDGDPPAVGFIVETSDGFKLLDERLQPLSQDTFRIVHIRNELTVLTEDLHEIIFPLRKQKMRMTPFGAHLL